MTIVRLTTDTIVYGDEIAAFRRRYLDVGACLPKRSILSTTPYKKLGVGNFLLIPLFTSFVPIWVVLVT
jgi:hypothetical protein